MNRYKYQFFLSLFFGIILSVTSCDNKLSLLGQNVCFKVTSASAETKAAYSNAFFDENSQLYERIDWTAGDKIAIYSPEVSMPENKSAVFTVEGVKNDRQNSSASVKSSDEMFWGDAVLHHFYAVYPSPEADNLSVTTSFTGNSVSGNIPADQSSYLSKAAGKDSNGKDVTIELVPDLKRYMMMAGMTSTEPTPDPIDIDFSPLTTCIDFTIKNGTGDPLDIKRITLSSSSSEAYSGGFTYKFSDKSFTNGAVGNSVSMNFSDPGTVSIKENETLRFKFFLNPCNDIKNPVFTIVSQNGVVRQTIIKPKTGDFEIESGCKKIINGMLIPQGFEILNFAEPVIADWESVENEQEIRKEYNFRVLSNIGDIAFPVVGGTVDILVESYKINALDGSKIPVVPAVKDNSSATWLTIGDAQLVSGCTYRIPVTSASAPHESVSMTPEDHADILKNNPEKADFDLSFYNPATGIITPKQNTANCYVVNSPGTYRFPLVYGNAIKDGATNANAYTAVKVSNYDVLTSLQRHDGNAINNPWIKSNNITVSGASILWQDASGLVSDVRISGDYIFFSVSKDNIRQGNCVIVAKNAGGDVVWSWHIWVTDEDLTRKFSTSSVQLAEVNLGWCSTGTETVDVQKERVGTIKLGNGHASCTFNLTQSGQINQTTAFSTGNCPFYQWGRKDPICPVNGSSYKVTYDASGTPDNDGPTKQSTGKTLADGIKNPGILYSSNSSNYDWLSSSYNYDNLWNRGVSNDNTEKTVYDPCPVGFHVPAKGKMTTFVSGTNTKTNSPSGYFISSLFFHSLGHITYEGIKDTGSGYYWTSTSYYTSYNDNGQLLMFMTSDSEQPKVVVGNSRTKYGKMNAMAVRPEFE